MADTPIQRIDEVSPEYRLEVIRPTTRHDGFKALAVALVKKQMDLSTGPLFEAKLFKLADQEHMLLLVLDHLIADGASLDLLRQEIWTLYGQATRGEEFSLPTLPVQFPDYAVWQKDQRERWMSRHAAYWRERLHGVPRIQIPFDGRGLAEVPVGAALRFVFDADLTGRLRDLARQHRMSLALVMLTVYSAAMSRWCDQRDFMVSVVTNGRYRPELNNVIGNFSYHLHLRMEHFDDDSFVDLMQRVSVEYYAACDHQDFGWTSTIIEECRDTYRKIDAYFNWSPAYGGDHMLLGPADHQYEGVTIQKMTLGVEWPIKFRPTFLEAGSGIELNVQFRPDLISAGIVEKFGRGVLSFAQSVLQQPRSRLASIVVAGL